MGWIAHRTPRNTLHVINQDDGSHFEARDEQEAQENIDAISAAKEEAARQAELQKQNENELAVPVGDAPTLRVN